MATDLDFARYVQDQLSDLGKIDVNKMFGEYGVYLDGKIIALLCDNVFYLKRTAEVVPYLREILEAPPYQGGKPTFVIEQLDDREYLQEIVKVTYDALPQPKPKTPRKTKRKT